MSANTDNELDALLGRGQRQQLAEELAPLLANGSGRLVITFDHSRPQYIEQDPDPVFLPDWEERQFDAVWPAPRPALDFNQVVPEPWRGALVQALQQMMAWGWGKLYILVDRHRIRAIYPVRIRRMLPSSRPLGQEAPACTDDN